jgi:hypothetical protein
MGTRSKIQVEGCKHSEIYKHWDGYPDAMMQWLQDFNQDFANNRGNDPDYKLAQLLRFSITHADKYELDPSPYTGWGITKFGSNCGEEYLYILKADGTVTYKEVPL